MKLNEQIYNTIFNSEFKNKLVEELATNPKYDIPILTDKTEKKIYNAIYDCIKDVAKKFIVKK